MTGNRGGRGRGAGGSNKSNNKNKTPPVFNLAKEIDKDICPNCENTVKTEENGLNCEDCCHWWHAKCCNISDEKYEWLAESDNIVYVCDQCRSKGKDDSNSNAAIMKKLSEMMLCMQTVLASNDKITMVNNDLVQRVTALESSRNIVQEEIKANITKQVKEEMGESAEREKRRLNLIIQNVPESTKEESADRTWEDNATVFGLLQMVTEIGTGDFTEPIRLGAKSARPRAIKITVKEDQLKQKIIREYFSKINRKGTAPQSCIYINHDLTPIQRREDKALREELKERRKNEKDLVIRNGKIITKPPVINGGNLDANHPGSPTAARR